MKTISHILLALVTVAGTLAAQTAEQGDFPFRIGASGQDYGKAIAVDSEDSLIVAALYSCAGRLTASSTSLAFELQR